MNNLLSAIEKGILQSGNHFLPSLNLDLLPGSTLDEIYEFFHQCIKSLGYVNVDILGYYGDVSSLRTIFIDSESALHQYNDFENEILTIHRKPFDNLEEVIYNLLNQIFTVYHNGKKYADVIDGIWSFTDTTPVEIEIIETSSDAIW